MTTRAPAVLKIANNDDKTSAGCREVGFAKVFACIYAYFAYAVAYMSMPILPIPMTMFYEDAN